MRALLALPGLFAEFGDVPEEDNAAKAYLAGKPLALLAGIDGHAIEIPVRVLHLEAAFGTAFKNVAHAVKDFVSRLALKHFGKVQRYPAGLAFGSEEVLVHVDDAAILVQEHHTVLNGGVDAVEYGLLLCNAPVHQGTHCPVAQKGGKNKDKCQKGNAHGQADQAEKRGRRERDHEGRGEREPQRPSGGAEREDERGIGLGRQHRRVDE